MPTGELLRLGSYSLLRPLAHGGMADVYLAQKDGDDRHVALKILAAHRMEEPESCALFLDEGRVVQLLDHANVAKVFDVAVDGEIHFMAMEHIHGFDLRDTLNMAMHVEHAIPFATAISIVCAAGRGLDHAHRANGPDGAPLELVHRDVSLSNIMIGHDGIVKVVDFGIASTKIQSVHTEPGVVRGKASYMAPEQCLGDAIDRRTDVFALGIVLYEITTNERCFAGLSDFDRMMAIVKGEWRRPSDVVPGFPTDLEAVIATALATDPGKRYVSAAAMVAALERVAMANGWALGVDPIRELMTSVFGTQAPVDAELDAFAIEPTLPELAAIVLDPFEIAEAKAIEDSISMVIEMLPLTNPTASVVRRKRLARGTESDTFDESLAANQDEWSAALDAPRRGWRSAVA